MRRVVVIGSISTLSIFRERFFDAASGKDELREEEDRGSLVDFVQKSGIDSMKVHIVHDDI